MIRNRCVVLSVVVGLSTLLPWIAVEIISGWPHLWRSISHWASALVMPATLAIALIAAFLARSWPGEGRAFPVALAGGATLGYVIGRSLVVPVWGVALARRGAIVQMAALIQVAIVAIVGAYASTRAAEASARRRQ